MTRRLLTALTVLVAGAVAACGGGRPVRPVPVSPALAPSTILGGSLHLYANTAPNTVAAFRADPKRALISDGRLWEIRRADRLIGTLEIATVKPGVNLGRSSVRDSFTSSILLGAASDIRLAGQEVSTVSNADGVSTMIWFGTGLFEIVQLKDPVLTGAAVTQAIIEYQQTRPEWLPLPELYSPS